MTIGPVRTTLFFMAAFERLLLLKPESIVFSQKCHCFIPNFSSLLKERIRIPMTRVCGIYRIRPEWLVGQP